MDLGRIGHELARVLHVRVREECEVRGLLVIAVQVVLGGTIVVLGRQPVVLGGVTMEIGAILRSHAPGLPRRDPDADRRVAGRTHGRGG